MPVADFPATKIEEVYQRFCNPIGYCDIHEHLPTLRKLAESESLHGPASILELGVREGKSTSAFLAAYPCVLISVDIDWSNLNKSLFDHFEQICDSGCFWKPLKQDSRIPLDMVFTFDILFVDTMHNEKHVRAELAAHLDKVRPNGCVIFHDTETNKTLGDDGGEGIWKPIEELIGNGWELEHHYPNNNGLTVIRRTKAESAPQ